MSKWQGKVKGNRMSSKETQFIDHNYFIKSVRMIIVPDNEMVIDLDNGEGFSAISSYTISENRIADSVLTVYVAVPWETYKKSSKSKTVRLNMFARS